MMVIQTDKDRLSNCLNSFPAVIDSDEKKDPTASSNTFNDVYITLVGQL